MRPISSLLTSHTKQSKGIRFRKRAFLSLPGVVWRDVSYPALATRNPDHCCPSPLKKTHLAAGFAEVLSSGGNRCPGAPISPQGFWVHVHDMAASTHCHLSKLARDLLVPSLEHHWSFWYPLLSPCAWSPQFLCQCPIEQSDYTSLLSQLALGLTVILVPQISQHRCWAPLGPCSSEEGRGMAPPPRPPAPAPTIDHREKASKGQQDQKGPRGAMGSPGSA